MLRYSKREDEKGIRTSSFPFLMPLTNHAFIYIIVLYMIDRAQNGNYHYTRNVEI